MMEQFNQSGGGDIAENTGIPLGTNYELRSPLNSLGCRGENTPKSDQFSKITGEISDLKYSPEATTIERYSLQKTACEILSTKHGKRDRTCTCLRTILSGADGVLVKQSIKTKKCYYTNLMVCGSVWKCPLCNVKISESRAMEIGTAINCHVAVGGKVALLTFTVPHERHDDLKDMVKKLQMAFARTWISPAAKRLKKSIGYVGYIRAKEVTWGFASGWHPHYHMLILYFSDKPEDEVNELIKNEMFPVWQNRCEKIGLGSPSYEHGLDVRGGKYAAEYIAKFDKPQKWGFEKELTKGQSKKSKVANRYGPYDLLREYKKTGSPNMARLFLEYCEGFHGSQFVTWSVGLKDEYGVDDSVAKDKELAKTSDEASKTLSEITPEDWKKIEFHHKRAEVIILAAKGWAVTQAFINSLARPYKKKRKKAKPKLAKTSNVIAFKASDKSVESLGKITGDEWKKIAKGSK